MCKEAECGVLYAIGLGPGDPELLTVKGARVLSTVGHVFVPRSGDKSGSLAAAIAAPHLPRGAQVVELVYPMTRDRHELARRWREAAEVIASVLSRGENAAFLSLGDVSLYSTCSYLLQELRALLPGLQVEMVPGITSFCGAASRFRRSLVEGDEELLVLPTPSDRAGFEAAVRPGRSMVFMKVGRRLPTLMAWLRERGWLEHAALVERLGLPEERCYPDLSALSGNDEAAYLATVLLRVPLEAS